MNGRLFIRADGNEKIGLGHIMRSMTIADAFKKNGYECTYITSAPAAHDIFERRGYSVIEINHPYDEKSIAEAQEIAGILIDNKADYILVDSFLAGNDYLTELKKGAPLICINSTRNRLDTDYLINENIACDKGYIQDLYSETATNLLIGPEYTPIRNEFRGYDYIVKDKVKKILVTTGGSDGYNFMTEFLKRISDSGTFADMDFTFVSGSCNIHYDELESECSKYSNTKVIRNAQNMAELMQESDLAISAGGTTVLELAVSGVPTIGIAVAEDQVPGLGVMNERKMIRYAGHAGNPDFWLFDLHP